MIDSIGEPAFPQPHNEFGISSFRGLSVRDYFAGQALQGLVANAFLAEQIHQSKVASVAAGMSPLDFDLKVCLPAHAQTAYQIADAMLAQRKEPAA